MPFTALYTACRWAKCRWSARPLVGKRKFTNNQSLPKLGLYAFARAVNGEKSRIHLRIDADHSGILLVNASRVLHLNPSAATMAYLSLSDVPTPQAVGTIQRLFRVRKEQVQNDYQQFANQLDELVRPDGACPIHDLEVEVTLPFSARPSAPYRMDLALTYRCNNDCSHCYNDRARAQEELTTAQWKEVIDRTWQAAIPYVVFTGGEPTLRDDLPELVAHAQKTNQVTGLNTNARRLSDRRYVDELVAAGLDHVQITIESHDPQIHDQMVDAKGAWKQTITGLRNVLNSPLYMMTNTTLLRPNTPRLNETLDFLAEIGVPTIGLNALIYSGRGLQVGSGLREEELPGLLNLASQKCAANNQRLIWYTPTQYCHFDPMQLQLGVKGCTAALYNMCVEPDGMVIPCQSYYQPVGNMLHSSWDSIWNHEISAGLRERQNIPEKCQHCALLVECGGGCPLNTSTGAGKPTGML